MANQMTAEDHRAVAAKLWHWFDKREIDESDATEVLLLLAGQMLRATRHGEPALRRAIGQAVRTLRQDAKEDVL
jgi:hypothetical protein